MQTNQDLNKFSICEYHMIKEISSFDFVLIAIWQNFGGKSLMDSGFPEIQILILKN